VEESDTRRWVVIAIGVSLVVALGVGALVISHSSEQKKKATEDFCASVTKTQDLETAFATQDPKQLDAAAIQLRTLTASAPSAIGPELKTLSSYIDLVVAGLDKVSPGDTAGARAVFEQLQSQVAGVDQAGKAVEAYTRRECGIDLRAATTVTTSVARPTAPTTRPSATSTVTSSPTN
jgi:hypothetical protein